MRRVVLLVATAAGLVPGSANAQGKADPFGYEAVHNYGRCAADRSPGAARQLLAMDYRAEDYGQALRRFVRGHNYCGSRGFVLKAGSLLFAGALAEALIAQSGRTELASRLALRPEQPLRARGELEMAAICTANRAPGPVSALLATPVGSAEEASAMAALTSPMAACLAGNTTLRVNRPAVRALLALAAWRLTQESAG